MGGLDFHSAAKGFCFSESNLEFCRKKHKDFSPNLYVLTKGKTQEGARLALNAQTFFSTMEPSQNRDEIIKNCEFIDLGKNSEGRELIKASSEKVAKIIQEHGLSLIIDGKEEFLTGKDFEVQVMTETEYNMYLNVFKSALEDFINEMQKLYAEDAEGEEGVDDTSSGLIHKHIEPLSREETQSQPSVMGSLEKTEAVVSTLLQKKGEEIEEFEKGLNEEHDAAHRQQEKERRADEKEKNLELNEEAKELRNEDHDQIDEKKDEL